VYFPAQALSLRTVVERHREESAVEVAKDEVVAVNVVQAPARSV
jgi:hypothetical protein